MVDLGFAISATDTGAGQTYENMKNVVKHIVNSYGLVSIRYGVILFGESATTYIPFSRTFPDEMALLSSLDLPQRLRGEPDLQKALEEAKTMFDQAVTFGKEADPQEIEKTTLNKNNVIQTDDNDGSEDIAVEVVERANNG